MGEGAAPRKKWPFAAVAAGVYLVITLAMFGDVLFSRTTMVSAPGNDQTTYGLALKGYGFGRLAAGQFPFWNPHVFCGTPYAANIQTGLFYPPNWLRMVMPGVTALNVSVALHFFLAAWLMALWVHARTRSAPASLLAGVVYACSGGYFLHVYPGHEVILAAATWAPGLFLCVDRLLGIGDVPPVEGRPSRVRWAMFTAFVVAMAILAGQPQVPYYTFVTAGLYALAHADQWWRRRGRVVTLVVGGVVGLLLAAVQLLPTAALLTVTTRSGGVTAESARQYALPWENVLTAIYPHLFGTPGAGYVGRWSLWEVSIFAGAVAVVLAAYAAATVPRSRRVGAVVLVLVLMAGVMPAAQDLLRHVMPGYASFRAAGRFGILIDLLVAMMAAEGLATMIRRGRAGLTLISLCLVGAVVSGVAAVVVATYGPAWHGVLSAIERTGESYVTAPEFRDPAFVARATRAAWTQLAMTAVVFALLAAALVAWRRRPAAAAWGVVGLAFVEVFVAARVDRASGPPDLPYPAVWARAMVRPPGRVMTVAEDWANVAMRAGFLDAYGYDPTVLKRYAMYLAVSQGEDPAKADFAPKVRRPSPLLSALRVGPVFYFRDDRPEVRVLPDPMPRFAWMHRCETFASTPELYAALGRDGFDPHRSVLLETPPDPAPAVDAPDGTVRVLAETPERIDIEATTPAPAVLLMTDAYAPGWRATDLAGSRRYDLLPADGAFRAIPLPAGTHRIRIEYVAPVFVAGAWVTGVTACGMLLALLVGGRGQLPRP
jgi:hypothetical protein